MRIGKVLILLPQQPHRSLLLQRSTSSTTLRFASTMTGTQEHQNGSTKWSSDDGKFRRQESTFRDAISKEKGARFAPALNRYHLITAMACPWAHRSMIVRRLKGIDTVPGLLPLHTVDSLLASEGWSFVPYDDPPNLGIPGTGNKVPGHEAKKRIREFYLEANPVCSSSAFFGLAC
jgi:putative glutathione S-transferase